MPAPFFPRAQQAQIIRANQRDVFHIASLKEQSENILRAFLGTRWLSRWGGELDLIVKLIYYGFTMGQATQTLGEEYTNIWQYSDKRHHLPPPVRSRLALVLLTIFPRYLMTKWSRALEFASLPPRLAHLIAVLPEALSVASEINLALFYLRGIYYDITKRALAIQYLSSTPEDPRIRPPSYSLLGIMITIRLAHRLVTAIRRGDPAKSTPLLEKSSPVPESKQMLLDGRPVATLLRYNSSETEVAKAAEEDEGTMLEITTIPPAARAGRNCTLCLEERTNTCSTECGHLFCWDCIVGWGREKAECPLCRQSLDLKRLLPIYNL